MANEKISEYLNQHLTPLNSANLRLDVSFDTTGGGVWETRYLEGTDLVTLMTAQIPTIYTSNGSLVGNRQVDFNAKTLSFTGVGGFMGIGAISSGTYKLEIASNASEDALRVNTNSESNVLTVIDNGVNGLVGIKHALPTEDLHNVGTTRLDGKLTRNIAAASSLSNVHFANLSQDGIVYQVTSATQNPIHSLYRTRGTIATPTAVQSGDIIGQYIFTSYGAATQDAANITAVATQNHGGSTMGTEMQFFTASTGSSSPTQKMVLSADGELGVGTVSPSEKAHIVGGLRVDAFTTNSVFVDTTKNFVGIRTATQLAGENMRLIGDLRVSSGVSLSTAAVAANTFATAAGGKLKLNAATIKDVSGTMDFETSNNSFLFRDNLSDFNMLKLTDNNVQMQSKDADAGATLRSLNLKIESSYWDGALNWNVATVKNEAQDTAGKHRLLFNIGGADRMTIQSDGVVTIEEFTVATLPADSAGGVIMVTDETGGYTMAFNDGVDWRRVQDRAIVA